MSAASGRRPTPASAATPERVLRRLEWRVIRRLDGRLQGDYRTMFHGVGIDFADLRDYELGDDVRHIDWNVTARMDAPFVRTFLEDRELTAWLLLDRSPSMGFGPTARPKELVLVELATTLARLFTRGGNRVGAILYNNAVERTDLTVLVNAAAATVRRRSLIILISDFISQPGWERPLSMLAERHELVAIRLVDKRELELPDAGLIVVEDVETGELLSVDTSDPLFRQRFDELVAERQAELRAATRRAGIELDEVSTDDDLVRAILRMIERRKQRR